MNLASLLPRFEAHVATQLQRAEQVLERENLELLAIHSGQIKRQFLDDMDYPFKANPLFKAWCPLDDVPHCWLLISRDQRPRLVILQPDDFWHYQPPIMQADWLHVFDVVTIHSPEAIEQVLPYDKVRSAYLGEHIEVAKALGFEHINPDPVLNFLHYHRLFKTDYELECMRQANQIAVRGHHAARQRFMDGGSEFDCLLAYMQASGQGENDAPYGHIIGQNEHAAVLHYMVQSRQRLTPGQRHSMLIDAGASYHGYAADITRTYSAREDEFGELVAALDQVTLALIDLLKPGTRFGDLHALAHEQIAKLLYAYGFVKLSPEAIVAQKISQVFLPHGLGHSLGLQVHDVGGTMLDERGTSIPPPPEFPTLRTTRTVEPRQVYTIEPGLYFIDSLLGKLKASPQAKHVDWQRVDAFRRYGGVRIEDNIIVHRERNENMTRANGLN